MASIHVTNVLGATTEPVSMQNVMFPCTVTLKSTAGGRLIRASTDDGQEYFIPPTDTDATTASQVVVTFTAPVSHIQFTGNIGDRWVIVDVAR